MAKVTFVGHGVVECTREGKTLLELARENGVEITAPCGGAGKCGKCRVKVNGEEMLACQKLVDGDLTVELPKVEATEIMTTGQMAEVKLDPARPGYLIAIDIGTTTVVCFLLSPEGKELAVESMLNPQSPYGADVITRIQNAIRDSMEPMTEVIRAGLTELIGKCCRKAGISPEEIGVVSVVGNPCMQQMFMGLFVRNLAAVPFGPVLKKAEIAEAKEFLPICSNAAFLVVPDISGYVGADTMAGILATRLYDSKETVLMVDIGTNGEMALIHNGRMTACSTAAGPALEGANIRFGTRGAKGAIDHVKAEDGKLVCSVIGGGPAAGICGSGIIDALAVMLNEKIINKRGRILTEEEIDGERVVPLRDGVYLTQDDVRQVQMAKGAIAAGVELMASYLGIQVNDIQKVILAGAFGSFMDPESACRIGLLPAELSGRITAAGNIAGTGSKMLAMDKGQLELSQKLLEKIEFIELAEMPAFQRTFAKRMAFVE